VLSQAPHTNSEPTWESVKQKSIALVKQRMGGFLEAPASAQDKVTDADKRDNGRVPRWLRDPTVIAAIIGLVGTLVTVTATVWISARREEPPLPGHVDRVVEKLTPVVTSLRSQARLIRAKGRLPKRPIDRSEPTDSSMTSGAV
jgi:hypothetical protein